MSALVQHGQSWLLAVPTQGGLMAQTQQRCSQQLPHAQTCARSSGGTVVGGAGGLAFKQNHPLLGGKKRKSAPEQTLGPILKEESWNWAGGLEQQEASGCRVSRGINISASKALLEEPVRSVGPRRTAKPEWARLFFLPFNFLSPLCSEASGAEWGCPSPPGRAHFKAQPGQGSDSPELQA